MAPGSRRSEQAANFPGMVEVAYAIRREYPEAKFLIPTIGDDRFVADYAGKRCFSRDLGVDVMRKLDAFDEFVPQCDLVLCKSGTSTVHVAAYNIPMIVVYHVNPLLWHGIGKRLVKTRKIAMVNILAGQSDVVPEFIPFTDPSAVAACALDLLKHPEKLAEQRQKLAKIIRSIERPGASMNVAKLALALMDRPRES
jgi:lipid-A-disaccharide synthase